jgi:NAD(P)-dependent dehydrogenase (short-subunit alcohol dehydrogenase family)
MRNFANKVAAITGAGSGIGRSLALQLAEEGCLLALSDVNGLTLGETVELCKAKGARASGKRVDVSDRDEVYAWANSVVAEFGAVHMIFNNAGVALGATVDAMEYADFEWLMGVNFWGVVYGTKAFLPHIKHAGEGAIVNVSSIFGLVGIPTQSAYNAAKFAVRGFTESLREELEIEGLDIGVTCVHPGGIKTNIAKAARTTVTKGMIDEQSTAGFERAFITTADSAASTILDGVRRNARRVLIGPDAYAVDWLQRLLPASYQKLIVLGGKFRRRGMLRES